MNEGEKVGLIGINGTGKSTLLKIVAGLEEPDQGSVTRGRNLYIRYLPQIPEFRAGETVLESVVGDNEKEAHYASPDELKASALASVLLSKADLLVLAEPTNHLDSQMADWLESYLKGFKGALLMITMTGISWTAW